MNVETNCLRDSDLIPRHSFLSTTFSIVINGVLNFMCVFACSLVADKANLNSELSKYKQSKSILNVMIGYALAERYISFKAKTRLFCLIVTASLI